MTPIFEPLFADCSFGYRPGRSPHMAMRKVWREINEGNLWILDADLRSYFDKIDQERLVGLIAEEISDGRVLRLIRSFLEAGVIVDGAWEPTKTGVPQGGVASPLWSNIYLTPFDHAMTKAGYRLTRWADDFVIVCRTRQEAEAALATARAFLHERLGVSLHPEKTRNRARLLVQLSGRNNRNASMTGTSPCASVSDTSVWQLAVLPSAEAYCGATPTECAPFLGNRGVIDHQRGIAAADEPIRLNKQFHLHRRRIPDPGSNEVMQLIIFAKRKSLRHRLNTLAIARAD